MNHVLFALFDNADAAHECARTVRERPSLRDSVSVAIYDATTDTTELPVGTSAAREGATTGALMAGALGGLLGGLVLGPIGFIGAGPLAAVLFGAVGGGTFGALGGGLMGAAAPAPILEQIQDELKNGKVLLMFEPQNMAEREEIEHICHTFHGRIAHKPVFGLGETRFDSGSVADEMRDEVNEPARR